MALPEDDWLPQAKRLAVGMRVRVRHGRERRPNMTVGNERGHFWAYCQSCKEGGKVSKDHVLRAPTEPQEWGQELTVPDDLRPVLGSDYELPVGRFLASKGMMFPYLPKLWFSERARRLCLHDPASGWHGRDITERSSAKWLHYSKPQLAGEVGRLTIITEDLFSMYKVQFALRDKRRAYELNPGPFGPKGWWNVEVASTLGAGIGVTAALALKDCTKIVWMYDGDKAGDDGFTQASKRMRVHVPKQYRARPPEGMDPKDMDCADIRALIEETLA